MSNTFIVRPETQVEDFLSHIFPHPFDQLGYVEIRLLDDLKRQPCQGQRWYRSIDEIMEVWFELTDIADGNRACIAFSPAIRKCKSGKKKDVHGTWCLWNDQNLENGNQHDCLERLLQDDLSLIVVNSGNCAHGYVLLDEFCDDIEKIERANSLLKHRLGGDNVWDAGRVMRVPGTLNYKDLYRPQPCNLIELTKQRYNIDEVIELLERDCDVSTTSVSMHKNVLSDQARFTKGSDLILDNLDDETVRLMNTPKPVGHRSEHDLAVVNRLVAADCTDADIKSVFARYPCGDKAKEGNFDQYLQRTINKARNNGHLFLSRKKEIFSTPEDLQRGIGEIRASEKSVQSRQEGVAALVTDYFHKKGQFFSDGVSNCHVHFDGVAYELSDNRRFRSMLQDVCRLSLENKDGKLTLDRLANHALIHGQVASTKGPIYANRRDHRIYVHCGDDRGDILRISPGKVERIKNGTNEDRVCLLTPPEMEPFEYQEDVDVRTALDLYSAKLIDLLACDEIDRLTLMLWLPNVFLLDYSTIKIVMKFSGAQASGKTVASRLLGLLVAGSDILKIRPTAPSIYSDPMPIQILDNVENRDLRRSCEDIILFAATGGAREKMRLNTDNQRMRTQINCLLLLNGIESLDRSEILSRVYEIQFSRKNQKTRFVETEAIDDLVAARNVIISGWLRLLADYVLPRIADGGIAEWKADLDERHPDHPKSRSFEFLARMGLIAEAFERAWCPHLNEIAILDAARKRIDDILDRQGTTALEADTETNALANLIQALVAEHDHWDVKNGTFRSRYHLEVILEKGHARLSATASDLCYAFSVLTKNTGMRGIGVRNPRSLAARLSSDSAALERCGMEVKVKGKKNKTNVYAIDIDRDS